VQRLLAAVVLVLGLGSSWVASKPAAPVPAEDALPGLASSLAARLAEKTLRAPDGSDMWGRFAYREIVKPERLVWINSFSDKDGGTTVHPMSPDWPRELLTKVSFVEQGGKTTVTVQWTPVDASTEVERKTFEDGRGSMQQGWTGTFEQLELYLAL